MSVFPPLRKGSADRKARVVKLKTMMLNKGDKTTDQIMAQFCLEESVSIRIAKEYLTLLELAGVLKEE